MLESLDFLTSAAPLAARMRPLSLEEVVGQEKILKPGSPLHALATKNQEGLFGSSVVLWGPPGSGKTTLAQVIARESGRSFVELSAINAGVSDVRQIMSSARKRLQSNGESTLLFLDEIHRFSKSQQDALLPGVEAGWVTLMAATTENPSYSVVSPLLSRSLVVKLVELSDADVLTLLNRALSDRRGLRGKFTVEPGVLENIATLAQGDARRALTVLESAARSAAESAKENESPAISISDVQQSMQHALVIYDRKGDQHYDVISAFIKSIRGSDADAAIYWLARMIEGGEDPKFIARRLVILASEDIGLADPAALGIATACFTAVSQVGMPEGRIPLAEATLYLALAPKSNSAYLAIDSAIDQIRGGLLEAVPAHLRSNSLARTAGSTNAPNYSYPHDEPNAVVAQEYLGPKTLKQVFFKPKNVGFESELAQRWAKLKNIIRNK